ncbi:MAG TPA: tetratricopeptide repeat protein, partial [Polyangia bacterium]|nr:tetratricopeptide repeat protein [Polyangia bacterium]
NAELLLGSLEEEAGDFAAARSALSAAAKHAAAAKDDALAVRVWNRLHRVIAVSQVNVKDAELVLPMAEAALLRIDRPALLEADLLSNEGAAALQAGDYVQSEKIHRRALQLVERSGREGDSLLPSFLSSLAASIASQGRTEEARPLFERARAEDERIYGPDHPIVGKILTQLGLLYSRAEQYDLSVATLQRARTILEDTVGPDSPSVATVLVNLGSTYESMNRIDLALPVERRAVEIWSRPGAPENPDLCYALQGLANSLMLHSDFDEAWTVAERAPARFEASYGPDHNDTSYAQELLGELLYRRGKLHDAEQRYRRVFEIRQKANGDPQEVAQILTRIAEVQLHRGQLDGAQTTLADAMARGGLLPELLKAGGESLTGAKQHLLRRVLELRSELAEAQHRPADALADARRALALETDPGLAKTQLQLRVAKLGHDDPEPAIAAFEHALDALAPRDPNLPGDLLDLAEMRLRASDRQHATQLLDRTMVLPALLEGAAEDRARAYFLLARAHADQPAQARTLAKKAQALYAEAEPGVALDERRALARFVAEGR